MTLHNDLTTGNNKHRNPASPHSAGEVYTERVNYDMSAATATALANNDLISLCWLPKGCIPVDFRLDTEDMDGASSLALRVGLLNDDKDDLIASADLIPSTTSHQAAYVSRLQYQAGTKLLERQYHQTDTDQMVDRQVAMKITTKPGTPAAAHIRGALLYRAAESDE